MSVASLAVPTLEAVFVDFVEPAVFRLFKQAVADAIASPDPLGALSAIDAQIDKLVPYPDAAARAKAVIAEVVSVAELVVSKTVLGTASGAVTAAPAASN